MREESGSTNFKSPTPFLVSVPEPVKLVPDVTPTLPVSMIKVPPPASKLFVRPERSVEIPFHSKAPPL